MTANSVTWLAALPVGLPHTGWSQTPESLSDSDIRAGIDLGRSKEDGFAFSGVTTVGTRDAGHLEYTLTAQGPFGRIVSAAATSARNHQPFTSDSVTEKMRAPLLVIEARPLLYEALGESLQIIDSATLILLRRVHHDNPGDTASIEPIRARTFPVAENTSSGGRLRGQGVTGYFPLESVPVDDFEIVVIAGGREYRRAIGKKDRDRLR